MPVSWAQVKPGLDPKKFTLRTATALMKRNKAWDGYDEAAVSLKAILKKLGQ
jgi:bifunctional non-homologous end joining protein LigD